LSISGGQREWAGSGRVTRPQIASIELTSVATSHDGRVVAAGTSDGDIFLWIGRPGAFSGFRPPPTSARLRPPGPVSALVFSPSDRVVAAGSLADTVGLWRTDGRRVVPLIRADERISSLAFSQDGRLLAWGDWGGEVVLWDVRAHRRVGAPLRAHTDRVDRTSRRGLLHDLRAPGGRTRPCRHPDLRLNAPGVTAHSRTFAASARVRARSPRG
jgi:hypothetical protein